MAAYFQLWSPSSEGWGDSRGIALTGSTLAAPHQEQICRSVSGAELGRIELALVFSELDSQHQF